jgi:hypothetical protein
MPVITTIPELEDTYHSEDEEAAVDSLLDAPDPFLILKDSEGDSALRWKYVNGTDSLHPSYIKSPRRRVAFSETSQVRYFYRTSEEKADMRNYARRGRRGRRRRHFHRTSSLPIDDLLRVHRSSNLENDNDDEHQVRMGAVLKDVVGDITEMLNGVVMNDVKHTHHHHLAHHDTALADSSFSEESEDDSGYNSMLEDNAPPCVYPSSEDNDDSWICSLVRCGKLDD